MATVGQLLNMSPLICSAHIHRPYHSYNLNLVLAQQRIENNSCIIIAVTKSTFQA